QQQTAGEGLKGDADVVHDVEAEHHPVIAGAPFAEAAEAARVGIVHALHLADLIGADQAEDQLGIEVGQQPHQGQAAEEQQAGRADAAPFAAYQAWETAKEEADHLRTEVAAMTIELRMAAHRQLFQLVDQVTAVTARLGQGQVLAELSIAGGEALTGLCLGLAALECVEQVVEGIPVRLMVTFEQALLHGALPSRPWAIPLRCGSACSVGTCNGSARSAASSALRAADNWLPRSAKPRIARCSLRLSAKGAGNGSASASCGLLSGASRYTTRVPAAISPRRLNAGWFRQLMMPRV